MPSRPVIVVAMSRLSRLFPRLFSRNKDKTGARESSSDSKHPQCRVLFLDETNINIPFKGGCKGQYILDRVMDHLNLVEKEYFGLRYVDCVGQTHWLDVSKSLASQLKGCSLPYTFYFGVKFYAADPCKLREEITRYLFFLQVKQDILQGRLPVTFDEVVELSAYAVQSELGDYDPKRHTVGYVSEFRFVQNQTNELEDRISAIHRRLAGQTPVHVEYRFLQKVKWFEMFGVDLHPVVGEGNVEYFLGLTPTGIVVYKNKTKIGNYFWPRISKCDFKRKIFIIKVRDKNNDEHTYAFELHNKEACKHLWKCCIEHHAFFRLNQVNDAHDTAVKMFRLGSKHQYSGRTERQSRRDDRLRPAPSVLRVPSRRQQRRINSESRINSMYSDGLYITDGGPVTMVVAPEPIRPPRHRSLPELQGRESPRSVRSAPWEHNYDGGLYTCGKESPTSQRSDRYSRHPSDSESGISHRRKYFPSRKGSDNESDVSAQRRRRRDDSGSESDVSYRNVLQNRRNRTSNENNIQDKKKVPLLYPFADKENHPNGSIPSLHSAPAGEARQRRRRRRSKSPGVGKHFPNELKEHIEYDLVDTAGMSEEQLRDIAYVTVETKGEPFKIRYSPKTRQKIKMVRRKSLGESDRNKTAVNDRYETQSTGGFRPTNRENQSNRTSFYENNMNAQNTENNNKLNYEQISSSPVVQAPPQFTQARISSSTVNQSNYSQIHYTREERRVPDYEVIHDSPRSLSHHSEVHDSPHSQNLRPSSRESPLTQTAHRRTESGVNAYGPDNYVAHRWKMYHKYRRSRGSVDGYKIETADSEKWRTRPPPPSSPTRQRTLQYNTRSYQSTNYPHSRPSSVDVQQYSVSRASNNSYQHVTDGPTHISPQTSRASNNSYQHVTDGPTHISPQTSRASNNSYQHVTDGPTHISPQTSRASNNSYQHVTDGPTHIAPQTSRASNNSYQHVTDGPTHISPQTSRASNNSYQHVTDGPTHIAPQTSCASNNSYQYLTDGPTHISPQTSRLSNNSYQHVTDGPKHIAPQMSQHGSSRYVPDGPVYTAPPTRNHNSYQQPVYRQQSSASIGNASHNNTSVNLHKTQSHSGIATSRYSSQNMSSSPRYTQPNRPAASSKLGPRSVNSTMNNEVISQLLRSPGYNPDLCTEL